MNSTFSSAGAVAARVTSVVSKHTPLVVTFLTLSAVLGLSACSGGASAPGSSANAAADLTAEQLSSALGCSDPPGAGRALSDNPGATTYDCVIPPAIDTGDYVYFYLFTSRGAKEVFDSVQKKAHSSSPADTTMQVVGPGNWAVWGNVQTITVRAVDQGGKQSW